MSSETNEEMLAKVLEAKIKAKAAQAKSKDIGLMEWCRKYLPHYFTKEFCEVHYALCAEIDSMRAPIATRTGKHKLVMVPRGYAKTTFVSFASPLKNACEESEKYIILCSDTSDMAELYLKNIANELLFNEELRRDYPMACQKGEMWTTGRIETANNVCIEALGKGKNVRGRRFKQYRPTLVILDDPQSDEDVRSASTRQKDIEWFDRALIPAGDRYTNYFAVGNNLHRESIVGKLESRPAFSVIKFSAIKQWPTNMQLWEQWEQLYLTSKTSIDKTAAEKYYIANKEMLDEGAEVLWPEKESLIQLMTLRADIGHPAFAAEKLNEPRDPNRCEFKEEWFADTEYYQLPTGKRKIVIGYCDPARGSDIKRGDYSAIITIHYYPDEKLAYVEADIKKRPVATLVDRIYELDRFNKYDAFGIESNGFQQLLSEELFAKATRPMNIIPVENYGVHKNTRISRLSIWLERKFYRFKQGCPDTTLLIEQLLDHPLAAHDDGSDGLEGVTRLLTNYMGLDNGADDTPVSDDGLGENLLQCLGLPLY